MSYTNNLDNPELYFQTKLYTGNGGTQSITLDGSENMQPDWVWIKNRGATEWHQVHDSVRGVAKYLFTNETNAEGERSPNDQVTSFDSDGFSLGAGANDSVNTNSGSYVSWNWKAGGSASSNSNGSITSSVSANTTAGFSIVSYTGSGTISNTVGHGLGTTPNVIIIKNRDTGTSGWNVHHSGLSSGYNLQLQSTTAQFNSTGQGHIGTVGSSTFGFVAGSSGNDQVNDSSEKYIAYCLAEKKGYSKFGSYTGNGNANGTFVYTGFRPAWFIVKRTDSSNIWEIFDNKRSTFNVTDDYLSAESSDAETTGSSQGLDFLSNGVKMRNANAGNNASGGSYIYLAFAESPFVNSNGIPNNAR